MNPRTRNGCLIAVAVLLVGAGVLIYLGYRFVSDNFSMPDDLAGYVDVDSARTKIRSRAPAPSEGTRIDSGHVPLVLEGIDSAGSGWRTLFTSLEEIQAHDERDAAGVLKLIPKMIRSAMTAEPASRRAYVAFLNGHRLSAGQFRWTHDRLLAAAGVTGDMMDSWTRADELTWSVPSDASASSSTQNRLDNIQERFHVNVAALGARLDSIRNSGAIDSTDIRMALPYRDSILSRSWSIAVVPDDL